jgi:O-acetyl-ADP-ribose deacetylase (regulator of RNase III)
MITHKNGDLLKSSCNFICHQVNCKGAMGRGIAQQISEKFPEVKSKFLYSYKIGANKLGNIDIVPVDKNQYVINLYGQYNYGCHYYDGKCDTDYSAFKSCLINLKRFIDHNKLYNFTIGFPYKIACGLAGGNWERIIEIIGDILGEYNVEIWNIGENRD